MSDKTIGQRILNLTIVKLLIGLLVCVAVVAVAQIISNQLLNLTDLADDFKKLVTGIIVAIVSVATYCYLFRIYEKRKITEFSNKGLAKNLLLGIVTGSVLQALTILVIYLNNGYTIISVNPLIYLITPLTIAFTSAIFEEILFRGIIFRIIEEKLGSYLSLVISALIFGALHLANPNSSLIAAIGLAIQAGLLLGAAYIYSRNLWFPIAIHFAWNFTESAIFGAAVSGNEISKTLITAKIEGAVWFSGGLFGPEGSLQATLFCLVATVILLILSHREGKILKPFWKK